MAKNKGNKNGAQPPAAYEWKFTTGARVRFEGDTHNYDIDKKFNGKDGEVTNVSISGDGNPDACVAFDGGGSVWIHADDLTVLLAAGAERPVEEPGDHDTASTTTASQLPKLPTDAFEMGEVVQDCPVPLPNDVLLAKGKELAGLELEEAPIKARLAREKELAKNELAGFAARRSKLQAELRDGTEMKPVRCVWIGDPRDMSKKLVRTDMDASSEGAVVESHVLQMHELQMAFGDNDDDPIDDEPEAELGGDDAGDEHGEPAAARAH